MIRCLREDDAPRLARLQQEALRSAPLAFGASPPQDAAPWVEAAREQLRGAPDLVVFGAFDGDLVGSIGLGRLQGAKVAHRAHLWGMFVLPSHRRRGLGRLLLDAAVEHARSLPGLSWIGLEVSSAAESARRLYVAAGFETWGVEPDAMRHGERSVSEAHMALRLDG